MVTIPRIKFQIQQSKMTELRGCNNLAKSGLWVRFVAQIGETRLEIGCKIMTEVASSLLGQQLPSHAHIYDKAASTYAMAAYTIG